MFKWTAFTWLWTSLGDSEAYSHILHCKPQIFSCTFFTCWVSRVSSFDVTLVATKVSYVLICSSNMLILKLIGIWCWIAAFIAFHIIYAPMNPLLMSCTFIISALFVLMIMIKSIFVVSLAPWNTDFITLNTLHFELRVSTLESEEAYNLLQLPSWQPT